MNSVWIDIKSLIRFYLLKNITRLDHHYSIQKILGRKQIQVTSKFVNWMIDRIILLWLLCVFAFKKMISQWIPCKYLVLLYKHFILRERSHITIRISRHSEYFQSYLWCSNPRGKKNSNVEWLNLATYIFTVVFF